MFPYFIRGRMHRLRTTTSNLDRDLLSTAWGYSNRRFGLANYWPLRKLSRILHYFWGGTEYTTMCGIVLIWPLAVEWWKKPSPTLSPSWSLYSFSLFSQPVTSFLDCTTHRPSFQNQIEWASYWKQKTRDPYSRNTSPNWRHRLWVWATTRPSKHITQLNRIVPFQKRHFEFYQTE